MIGNKERQFAIINKNNPFDPNLGSHTWITSPSDIKTYEEVWEEEGEIYGITPDFSKEDAENALRNGMITVYSSYPIKQGIFVTPSRMEAQSYGGNGKVYRKVVRTSDIAWIDPTQGQYANLNEDKIMKKVIRLTESDLHNMVKESVKRILKETRFGRPEPFFGREINGRSGMLYCRENGDRCVLYDLHFMGNCIIGIDRNTNEEKTIYLTSLFAAPIDGSTIPSAHRQADNVVEITHLRVDGSDEMYNLTVDDYFGGPEETAERDFASGY